MYVSNYDIDTLKLIGAFSSSSMKDKKQTKQTSGENIKYVIHVLHWISK
jgi:hypothetical protein